MSEQSHDPIRHRGLVRPPRVAPRLARLGGDDDRGQERAPPSRRHRHSRLRHRHARGRVFRRRRFRRRRARQADADRGDHDGPLVVALDGVAGDGIDDARLLRALRSRSHPGVAGRRAGIVRRAHRDRRADGGGDGAAARRAVHRHADLPRRLALARRLRRDRRHGRGGDRLRGRAHCGAVPRHRPAAHAARGAGRRRGDRRRVRHRPASRGDPLLRHIVAQRPAAIENGSGHDAGRRQPDVVAGARRARRRHGAGRRARRELFVAGRRHRAGRAALRRLCHRRDRRGRVAGEPRPARQRLSCHLAASRRSAARNGSCCAAIRGSPRRR